MSEKNNFLVYFEKMKNSRQNNIIEDNDQPIINLIIENPKELPFNEKLLLDIKKLHSTTIDLISGYSSTFDLLYSKFTDKLSEVLAISLNQFNQIFNIKMIDKQSEHFDQFNNFFYKSFEKKIREITNIHTNLIDALRANLNNLVYFLETVDLNNKKSVVNTILERNLDSIVYSSLLSKINYKEFRVNYLNRKYEDLLKIFITQISKSECQEIIIDKEITHASENKVKEYKASSEDYTVLDRYKNTINKLSIKNKSFDDENSSSNHPWSALVLQHLKKLNIEDCGINKLDCGAMFPILTSMKLFRTNKLDWFSVTLPSTLIKLSITKALMDTDECDRLIKWICEKDQLRKGIEYISFHGNIITSINFNAYIKLPSQQFDNLKELNLDKNKLYSLKLTIEAFPSLRIINIIDNHFARLSQFSFNEMNKRTLVMSNKNLYHFSNKYAMEYYERLKLQLPQFDYSIHSLSYSLIFNIFNRNLLNLLDLSSIVKISLKELDLSYCALDNDAIIDYLQKIKTLPNLIKLNLKANYLTMEFFMVYIKKEMHKYYIKLEDLSLSNNTIDNEDFYLIYDFIIQHKNMKRLNLAFNPLSSNYRDEKVVDKKGEKDSIYYFDRNPLEINRPYDLIDLLMKIEEANRKVYIDFSDSKQINHAELEKKKICYKIIKNLNNNN